MAIMILFFAHDTQASLPVNAWQDKPNNSKPLCLTASPSTPSAVPKEFSSPSQHFLGHCLGTYLLFSLCQRPAVHVCSEPSPPQAPGCSCAQLCSSTPQEKPDSQKSSLLKFLPSLSASKPSPISYFKFPALSVRGELFCCFPAGKLHVGTLHPGPQPVRIPTPTTCHNLNKLHFSSILP